MISIRDDISHRVFNNEEEFYRAYPLPVRGRYTPQPNDVPEDYPVLAIQAGFIYVADGPDELIMLYVYDFEISD